MKENAAKKIVFAIYKLYFNLIGGSLDKYYLGKDVPLSDIVGHKNFMNYLSKIGNHQGMKILEIGSREVTGKSMARKMFANANYVGFDYYPGPNVDVVGDAHKLSQYFDEKFDIIYSSAVFEHLAMPWVAAKEIAKLLKVGGIVFVETHFAYSSHERPGHFYHYTDMALKTLFSPALGFECLESGMCNPIVGRFSSLADEDLKYRRVVGLYCHSEYLGRKIREVANFNWDDLSLEEIVKDTKYPPPSKNENE
ncbi:MAG: class I SAM-dependent methyltransferase [Candidatus Edwardsbacteria bacterium]|nr:class I SAM-dependent methyltransferase [Candidatus Edwardsbacteria bacterium]MBU1575615.1 class I SAM-dependent methyltransferase [Candidatus Edwardsbacteria bacterium]MBU2464040.1 class I SAM-dependent methyltransferase [Candidatus Edwardsbacteria bacterium]MBU2593881.1 class I SAM-dependent methyltransferase [Candidatus Edwardsbacteria bacterium]